MKITIATSQFPVSYDIKKNMNYIIQQMKKASKQKSHIIQFPEASLSGYAGVDFESFDNFDWETLKISTNKIIEEAKKLNIWVILGSAHKLSEENKPHNCLYIINNKGEIIDRYDKLFCAGNKDENIADLSHYTPGNHFCTFEIKGIVCGVLICHDYRYPELYRKYKQMGVEIMFHSYHAANVSTQKILELETYIGKDLIKINNGNTIPEITMPSTMISYAANNYMWISCSNSSKKYSCWGAFVVRPDGVILSKLKKNITSISVNTIDTNEDLYDSTIAWRDRAMNGVFHSGTLLNDKRSEDRTSI